MLASFDEFRKVGMDLMDAAKMNFQRGLKIAEVTSTKDTDSLQVHLLNELVHESNKDAEEARRIAAAFLQKVTSSDPVVKWKALKAIRYICQNATSSVFKKACGGIAAAPVRDAESWTGPNHSQLGNSLNMRVREAAKETLDEIFKLDPPTTSTPVPKPASVPDLRSRIQGYGSTTSARIQNSYAASAGLTSASAGLTSSKGESFSTGNIGKYGGFGSDDVHRAERAGNSWLAAAQVGQGNVRDGFTSAAGGTQNSENGKLGGQSAEKAAVAQLCSSSSGLRPQPTPAQLKTFVRAAGPLDSDALVMELSHKLVNTSWQTRVCALAGIKAAAEIVQENSGDHSLAMTVASLASMPELFDSVLTHDHPAVRQLALECASALGISTGLQTDAAGRAGGDAPGDLLGVLGGGDDIAHGSTTGAGVTAASANRSDNMLDLLGGDVPDVATAQPAAASNGTDLLAGLDDLSPAAPPAASVPSTGGASASKSGMPAPPVDLLEGLQLSGPTAGAGTVPTGHEDPLDGLTGIAPVNAPAQAAAPLNPQGHPPLLGLSPIAINGFNIGPATPAVPGMHVGPGHSSGLAGGSRYLLGAQGTGPGAMWAAQGPAGGSGHLLGTQGTGPEPMWAAQGSATFTTGGMPEGSAAGHAPMIAPLACNMKGSGLQSHLKPKDAFDFVNDELKR